MFPLWGLFIGLAAGFLMKGKLSNLENLPLKHLWLVFAGLLVQLLIFPTPWWSPIITGDTTYYHYASYILVALFFVVNWRMLTLWVMGLGMLLNAIVITANGGFMPADPDAIACAGHERVADAVRTVGEYANVVFMDETTQLNFLGDWICIPAWIPAASAISIGDVVLMMGLALLIAMGMRSGPKQKEDSDVKAQTESA